MVAGSGTPWSCPPPTCQGPCQYRSQRCGEVSIQPEGGAVESKLGGPSGSRVSGWPSHAAFKTSSPVLLKPSPELSCGEGIRAEPRPSALRLPGEVSGFTDTGAGGEELLKTLTWVPSTSVPTPGVGAGAKAQLWASVPSAVKWG